MVTLRSFLTRRTITLSGRINVCPWVFFFFNSGLKSLVKQRVRAGWAGGVGGVGFYSTDSLEQGMTPISLIEGCSLLQFDFGTGLIFSYNP